MENESSTKATEASAVTEAPAQLEPEAIVELLRGLRGQIPEYGHLPVSRTRGLHRVSRADAPFIQAAINAVGASEAMRQALGKSADDLRVDIDQASRWSAVEDELRALLQGVSTANLTRRYRIGLSGLQVYNIGRQLVRTEQHSDLLPHVAEMRRFNRFGRKRKVAEPQAPPVASTT